MRLTLRGRTAHLCYCTNIHAGESWPAVSASLDDHVPAVRAELGVHRGRFGIGLRLSGQAAQALDDPAALEVFQEQLARLDAYVFTVNAFPHGAFHGVPVKEQVYRPDWREPARLAYTASVAHSLARLLPDGVAGSISTVPGAFAADLRQDDRVRIATQLVQAVALLVTLERETGKRIVLALEPEPACMLETVDDVLDFFTRYLFGSGACAQLALLADVTACAAEMLLRRHAGVCYDVCHGAVAFEDPVVALTRLARAGIAVPKVQLSSALRIPRMDEALLAATAQLDQGVYLHQVVVRPAEEGATPERFTDLPQALAAYRAGGARGEWRIHCHVPIFLPQAGPFATTRDTLAALLEAVPRLDPLPHLEVETYTWDVLPAAFRPATKAAAIARELAYVIRELRT